MSEFMTSSKINETHFVVIPLRLKSSRLPEKILKEILPGKTLSECVIDQALIGIKKCLPGTRLLIAVDDQKTMDFLSPLYPDLIIMMTDPGLPSGTDRVNAAITICCKENKIDIYHVRSIINLQGDMPFFDPHALQLLQKLIIEKKETFPTDKVMATLCQKWPLSIDPKSPQDVKVIFNKFKKAIYFSRFPIPCSREYSLDAFYLHIGIYAYTVEAIQEFCFLESSEIEKLEGLEQLRALDNDIPIFVECIDSSPEYNFKGIDCPEDLVWASDFNTARKK